MQIDTLKPKTKRKKSKQIGRGGKRGKTSGKGHKGQKARAGHKIRPAERDFIKKIPKLRGHSSKKINRNKAYIVNLKDLEKIFSAGDEINPESLIEKGLIKIKKRVSSKIRVKILADGELSKKFTVSACEVSQTSKEKIEKAGGKIV